MDLTDVLREPGRTASIVDHEWMVDEAGLGRVGEPTVDQIVERAEKSNNITPELEVQWGGASGPDFDLEEPSGEVLRHIPEDDLADVSEVIVFARDQMNRGAMGTRLTSSIKTRFTQDTLVRAAGGLRELFKMEGVIGCVAVDAAGYADCREALDAADASPFKRHIKYVIGCTCGDPHLLPDGREMEAQVPDCTGNAIDDFFGAPEAAAPSLVAHCRSTMLPLLGQDLDDDMTSQTMTDMMNVTGLPQDVTKKMWKDKHNDKYSSNLEMVQAAFRRVTRMVEAGVRQDPPESPVAVAEDFRLARADNEIELVPIAAGDIEVNEAVAEMAVEAGCGAAIDVEMDQHLGSIFEGIDQVELDEVKVAEGDIEVERGGEITL